MTPSSQLEWILNRIQIRNLLQNRITIAALSVMAVLVFIVVSINIFSKLNSTKPLTVTWVPYSSESNLAGFLYTHEFAGTNFFLSTEGEFTETLLTVATGTLTLLKESSFFNPNACAKMPSVAWKNYLFFRDFGEKNSEGFSDILYSFNRTTGMILELRPKFTIVGDIYISDDELYFFYTLNGDDLYEARTTESIDSFSSVFITSNFRASDMHFFVGEPVFAYQGKALEKYRYVPLEKRFEFDQSYTNPQRLRSTDQKLIFTFPGTKYSFTDTKKFRDVQQELFLGDILLLRHNGALNVFPIGKGV